MAKGSRLATGTLAPDFSSTTLAGEALQLSAFAGKPVWLGFFRYAMCPLCNFRIHQMVQTWPERFGSRDFEMLAVFQSPASKLTGLVERHRPSFRVIPDPEMDLYRLYGVETKWGGALGAESRAAALGAMREGIPMMRTWDGPPNRVPADFLIDPGGTIRTVFYGENISQSIPFELVDAFLDEMGV